jgi:U3 small nucleolar RNA-associated protein 25
MRGCVQVRQLFERFAAASSAAAADARFEFFKTAIWPRLAEAGGGGLLLVVPSYFDFVRLR